MSQDNRFDSTGIGKCPDCGNTRFICSPANDEVVCIDCGLVTTRKKAAQATSRGASSKLQKSRNSKDIHAKARNKNLTRMIDPDITCERRDNILGRWQKLAKVSDQTEKNITLALSEITRIASHLCLSPQVLETASKLYKTVVEKRLTKGRSIKAFCAAVLYAACRQCGYTRTLSEVAKTSRISKKEIGRHYRLLIEDLNCSVPLMNLADQVPRILNRLFIQEQTAEIVYKILRAAEELKFTQGREPSGIVSAAIYIAATLTGQKRTQREISEVTRVSETSIRKRYKELEKRLDFLATM